MQGREPVLSPMAPVSTASIDRHAEARERMRKLKAEPVPVREPVKRLFEYDPDKPLTIDRSIKN